MVMGLVADKLMGFPLIHHSSDFRYKELIQLYL